VNSEHSLTAQSQVDILLGRPYYGCTGTSFVLRWRFYPFEGAWLLLRFLVDADATNRIHTQATILAGDSNEAEMPKKGARSVVRKWAFQW
jgi:hypothetical protein